MKPFYFLTVVVLTSTMSFAQHANKINANNETITAEMGTPRKMLLNGPNISVNTEVVDYGTIKKNSERLRTFTITNTGNEPLVIQGCAGNCGCTVPECPREPIMPGKSATISINYATERVGEFSKNVTITSNAVNEPNKVIKVSGTVIE